MLLTYVTVLYVPGRGGTPYYLLLTTYCSTYLAEYLEEVVVADEVEAREALPLVLEEVGERLLAALELVENAAELLAELGHL